MQHGRELHRGKPTAGGRSGDDAGIHPKSRGGIAESPDDAVSEMSVIQMMRGRRVRGENGGVFREKPQIVRAEIRVARKSLEVLGILWFFRLPAEGRFANSKPAPEQPLHGVEKSL